MSIETYKDLDLSNSDDQDVFESEMNLISIIGLEDPLREDVKGAIAQCKKSSVTVRMVTGDNIDTARAISLQAGIITPDELGKRYLCMTGKNFRETVGITIGDKGEKIMHPKHLDKFTTIAS